MFRRNAKIEGMADDLNLIKYRYNIVLSIFFITYLRFVFPLIILSSCPSHGTRDYAKNILLCYHICSVEVPSNVILKRFGPRFYSRDNAFSLPVSTATQPNPHSFPPEANINTNRRVQCPCLYSPSGLSPYAQPSSSHTPAWL